MSQSAELANAFDAKAWRDKRRAELRAKNICVDCGAEPASDGHVLCAPCLADRRSREKLRAKRVADERRKLRKELLWKGIAPALQPCETSEHSRDTNRTAAV